MLGDFEQKLGMTTSGVQLCSFGGCSPSQVTSTSPQEPVGSAVCIPPFWNVQHSSFCHCGKFLNTGASFFALAPEIVVAPVLGVHPTALKVCGRGEGGMVPLQPHRMGAALGWLPGRFMAFLGAPRGTNVTLQTLLLFPKLTKLSW